MMRIIVAILLRDILGAVSGLKRTVLAKPRKTDSFLLLRWKIIFQFLLPLLGTPPTNTTDLAIS